MMALDADLLRGSYPPIVTPFRDGAIDYDAYAQLVDYQIEEGSDGILVNGTSAEPSTLSVEERNRLVTLAIEVAAGRVPVVAATGSQSHAETVALTEHADRSGASALLVVTPYYIRPPQRGLAEYYIDIGRRTAAPLMIYHIPGRAAIGMDVQTVERIAEETPNLVGMKHAVNDLNYATQLLARMGADFRLFVGLEELSFPMLAVGACGLMNAVGNLLPRRMVQLCEMVAAGDLIGARALHYELYELNAAVFYDTNPIPIKYMMCRLGLIAANEHRLPMVPATPELERRLDGVLERAGLIEA